MWSACEQGAKYCDTARRTICFAGQSPSISNWHELTSQGDAHGSGGCWFPEFYSLEMCQGFEDAAVV